MHMKFFRIILFIEMILNFSISNSNAADFVWFDGSNPVSYYVFPSVSPVVNTSIRLFSDDIKQVTGIKLQRTSQDSATIRIIQLDKIKDKIEQLKVYGVPVDELSKKHDGFFINIIEHSNKKQILIVGSDARGTAYGVLELSRVAGVSPWIWWNDVIPMKKSRLIIDDNYKTMQSPSVEYRGIFLNDEDWSLQPWSWNTFEKGNVKGMIGPKTYKKIFELLLRLRANTIWPGMHGLTTPFYEVPGAKDIADSCGIVIGTSHCEPLMRNNVGEWNEKKRGAFNYVINSENVKKYWAERLEEVGHFENIYTIGMRGIHDGAMEGVKTLSEKTSVLQNVINDQRELLIKYVNRDITKIPQIFIPYKEVLQVMDNGLRIPDDITLMWCDDNYGYLTRLSDTIQQKRSGGAGVYYHLSYWGRPHDYLWLTTTQPGLIYNEMKLAYDCNARKVWIVNVHDLKPAAYDLELFFDMAWDINSVHSNTLNQHLANWLCTQFGEEAGKRLFPAMKEFYRLCGIRKPELMGWNQIELSKLQYSRGWSPVVNTEFSISAFGDELDRYLDSYYKIKNIVTEIEKIIPSDLKDAYFMQIKYPVFGAADMSIKMLEAQRARTIADGSFDTIRWNQCHNLVTACVKSQKAYNEIKELTSYYNNKMTNGKWKNSMCDHPRDLYVFYPPILPVTVREKEMSKYVSADDNQTSHPIDTENCIVSNACDYAKSSSKVESIQMLGHSMNAVSLPKGSSLSYKFSSNQNGNAILRIAMIPTHPQNNNIRYSVSIDGEKTQVISLKEKFRSDGWKTNVLRGQAVNNIPLKIIKGTHILMIKALDDHIVVDQWMIDFNPDRKFYMFPIESE